MPYRNIFIANKAQLRLSLGQLIVNNGEEYSFPIEDIRSIVIDNPNTSITAKLAAYLGNEGVCVILCDEKHLPCCQLLPTGTYCRTLKRINLQLQQTKPKLKNIWRQIVIRKIENQAKCLDLFEKSGKKLIQLAKAVQSGDSTNREGYAAGIYFKELFGKGFTRSEDSAENAALNYGYAIIRSFIARTIAAYGLEPSIGVHHKNQLNAFNLADDLIEPFRPSVDIAVFKFMDLSNGLSTYEKAFLQKLLNSACRVDGNSWSIAKAIELEVQSLIECFESKEVKDLKLPETIETAFFDYE